MGSGLRAGAGAAALFETALIPIWEGLHKSVFHFGASAMASFRTLTSLPNPSIIRPCLDPMPSGA